MPTPRRRPDETLVKALVRAHRWRRRIESGRARSITDLAEQEGVTDAYVCRLLPLPCLAPDLVEAILDGRQPKGLRLAEIGGKWSAGLECTTGRLASPGAPLGSTPKWTYGEPPYTAALAQGCLKRVFAG